MPSFEATGAPCARRAPFPRIPRGTQRSGHRRRREHARCNTGSVRLTASAQCLIFWTVVENARENARKTRGLIFATIPGRALLCTFMFRIVLDESLAQSVVYFIYF